MLDIRSENITLSISRTLTSAILQLNLVVQQHYRHDIVLLVKGLLCSVQ